MGEVRRGGAGDDGHALPRRLAVAPVLPDRGEGQGIAPGGCQPVRPLGPPRQRLPFIEARGRDQASPRAARLAEGGLGCDGFRPRVDEQRPALGALVPVRHEAPAHVGEAAARCPARAHDDGDVGGRPDVGPSAQVARIRDEEGADLLLQRGMRGEASAHALRSRPVPRGSGACSRRNARRRRRASARPPRRSGARPCPARP